MTDKTRMLPPRLIVLNAIFAAATLGAAIFAAYEHRPYSFLGSQREGGDYFHGYTFLAVLACGLIAQGIAMLTAFIVSYLWNTPRDQD